MNLRSHLNHLFIRTLLSTPRGRAHLLNQVAESEEQGEQRIFDDALMLVDDPDLQKLVRRHRDDEIRHGEMFREVLRENGIAVGPVPAPLDLLGQLDDALGGFFARGLSTDHDVMRAYVILQVIEERACEQFGMYIEAFDALGRHETAAVFREVAQDEARHLKYCRAIALRYADDAQQYERELSQIRDVEARTFKSVQQANIAHILEHDLSPNVGAKLFFALMQRVSTWVDEAPYTTFAAPMPA